MKTNQQSKVTRTAVAGVTEIHPGDTVIVQGDGSLERHGDRDLGDRDGKNATSGLAGFSAVAEGGRRQWRIGGGAARARPTAANERTRDMSVEEYEDDYEGGGNARLVIAAVVAVVLIAGAFFAGKAMAGSGPKTLADAVKQAQAGDLPCGDTGAAPTPAANGAPPAGGFGANGAQFMVRAICDRTQSTSGAGAGGTGGTGTGQGRFGGGAGGGLGFGLTGQVTAVTSTSLTIQSPRGNQTVKLGPSTKVSKSSSAAASDIKKGDTVVVGGAGGGFRQQQSQSQSTTATSVLIVPSSSGN